MHGEYVRGWKYDWEADRAEMQKLIAAGRHEAAAFIADPGCVGCKTCGETHWREFEVFLCFRCGAECTIVADGSVESGPPTKPENVPPRLKPGLRVEYLGHLVSCRNKQTNQWEQKRRPGNWPAGRVVPGSRATVRFRQLIWDVRKKLYVAAAPAHGNVHVTETWLFEFDGLTPKPGYIFGAGFGPFLPDDFVVVSEQ